MNLSKMGKSFSCLNGHEDRPGDVEVSKAETVADFEGPSLPKLYNTVVCKRTISRCVAFRKVQRITLWHVVSSV